MSSSWFAFGVAIAGVLSGCDSGRPQQQGPQARPESRIGSPGIIDAKLAATCVVSFGCFLSHPGLGSSGSSSTVDLATCTRMSTSYNRPYDEATPPPDTTGSDAGAPAPAPVPPEACTEIKALLSAITVDDARAAQESAQVDTAACQLTVSCPGAAEPKLRVQRQTTGGGSRVEQLIRAIR